MKRFITFILFCAAGFGLGYWLGVPFYRGEVMSVVSSKPLNVEEIGADFVSLTPQAKEAALPHRPMSPAAKPRSSVPPNPENAIAKLTLAEVQARLDKMNGQVATAETDELEQLLVNRWATLDPIGSAEYAAYAVTQGGSPRLLQTAAKAWAKSDPANAAEWAATLDSPMARDIALGQIFNTWSATNPIQAASAIASLPMGSAQTVATSAVAKNFIKGNLNAALRWSEELTGPVQIAAAREIINFWSTSDPGAAGAWIMQQASPQLRTEALRQLAGNWVSRDPAAAISYAQTITDAGLRDGFIKSAVNRFSTMDPLGAANWLASDASRPYASSLIGGVSSRWADFDPNSAAGWATSIADSTLRDKALSAVSTSWGRNSPEAAARWIGSLGDAQAKDVATAAFSMEIGKANPAMAAQWASRISDPAKLNSSLKRIVGEWKKIAPDAARSFVLSSTNMPANLRQELLR